MDDKAHTGRHMSSLTSIDRRLAVAIFALLFLTYAYGRQTPSNANPVSRAALGISILDQHTFSIDRYQSATPDKAWYAGHYFTEKAPGLSFAALPSMGAAYLGLKLVGRGAFYVEPATGEPSPAFKILTMIGTVFTSGVLTALAAASLFLLGRGLGVCPRAAVFAALAFGLGTPAWGWATAFFGHAVAGGCLLLGFSLAAYTLETSRQTVRLVPWIATGFLLSYAVVTEYPAAPAAAIIWVLILLKAASRGRKTLGPVLLGLAMGTLPCAVMLFAYNQAAFGSWFRPGYQQVVGFQGMQQGMVGLTYPKASALYGILLSLRRGVIWLSPLMVVAPYAVGVAWRRRPARPYIATAALVVAYFLAFNASYFYWDGGFSTGPRHITPALGFACLPLAFLWQDSGRTTKNLMLCALGLSMLLSFACASVSMTISPLLENPLLEVVLPSLVGGRVNNLGELVGIPRYWNLMPWCATWALGGRYIAKVLRENPLAQHRFP